MPDEKNNTTEVVDEETPGGIEEDGQDKQKISETVKNLSSKSLKQISKWNNESFLYAFDRQLISFGIRLLLFLPGFAILAYFGAWAYANSSPDWWVDFIEPLRKHAIQIVKRWNLFGDIHDRLNSGTCGISIEVFLQHQRGQ